MFSHSSVGLFVCLSVCPAVTKISQEPLDIYQFTFAENFLIQGEEMIKIWMRSDSRWPTDHNESSNPPLGHYLILD